MSDLLHQLESDEAILLMYLAGELPERERVEVEQRLVNDADLRTTLADLSALQCDVTDTLARAELPLMHARRESAVRRVARAMTAAREESRVATVSDGGATAGGSWRIPWWSYPIAAAALLLLSVFLVSDNPKGLAPPKDNTVAFRGPAPVIFLDEDPAVARLAEVEERWQSMQGQELGLFDADLIEPEP